MPALNDPNDAVTRLATWIAHWRTDRQSSISALLPVLPADASRPQPSSDIRPYDSPDFIPGDIRLLDPWLVRGTTRPLLFAVLREWMDGLWLIAPFSRFPVPATVGEWMTGFESSEELAVLSLWNAHTVPYDVLRKSWFVARLNNSQLANAWSVFQHVATGKPISDDQIKSQIGVPLNHPADPRHDYLTEEVAMMSPLALAAEQYVDALENGSSEPSSSRFAPRASDIFVSSGLSSAGLALSSGPTAALRQIFNFEPGLRLILTKNGPDVRIQVAPRSSNQISKALDGGTLVVRTKVLAKFYDGQVVVKQSELIGEIALRNLYGEPVPLTPVGE